MIYSMCMYVSICVLVEQLYAQYRQQWKQSCDAAKREKTLINPFEIQMDPV